MLKVGLTGGIACGKSTVLEMFAAHGAQTLRADLVAHELMSPGTSLYGQIVAAFGSGVLAADGTIARPKLAAMAFPARIGELNAIVHPAVLAYADSWMQRMEEKDANTVAICEAALLIEAGWQHGFDRLIVVTCSLEQKIARFARRSGLDEEAARAEVLRRMAAQMPEAEKARLGDYVIDNSSALQQAELRVAEIWQELATQARRQSH